MFVAHVADSMPRHRDLRRLGQEHGSGARPRGDVEEVGEPGAVVTRAAPQRHLDTDERRAGEQPVRLARGSCASARLAPLGLARGSLRGAHQARGSGRLDPLRLGLGSGGSAHHEPGLDGARPTRGSLGDARLGRVVARETGRGHGGACLGRSRLSAGGARVACAGLARVARPGSGLGPAVVRRAAWLRSLFSFESGPGMEKAEGKTGQG
ncbi:hypothetical protein U9M48_027403 [Paspalum notatum var. saurae]|uniref:Uncharacterized protein n=1 Tax=Paspalum notatum var. saurae TaxID=547442 RepID=A0AAQ3TUB5_PASNO